VFDWLFRNRETGRITVAQFPNAPLWVFLVAVVTRWLLPVGGVGRDVLDGVAVAGLGWWAVDELLRGVNPWRRLLGAVGLSFAALGLVRVLR
jgi:hypothetical protein